MDNPNITMEDYIRFEEEKARRRAIVFNDELSSEKTLSCEPTVSYLNNNEIDFRVSFNESADEDYTVTYDKNSFSYKIIYVNDLKTNSENDNEKVNMPSFPSPEPKVSCFDDLYFFKDFENEFPAIVYNDALTSKSEYLTEPTLCPQHINEFNLKDETSLSEYDEVEQNIFNSNDLFLFNIIYLNDLKSGKDNNDNEIDIIQSSREASYLSLMGYNTLITDIADFEERLGRIYDREVHRVQVFDFGGLTELMDEGLKGRMLMGYRDAQGQSVITSRAWRRLFEIWSSLVHLDLERDLMLRLCHRLITCSIAGRSQAPEKVTVTDLFYLRGMDVGSVNIPYLLAMYLRLLALGRKRGAMISEVRLQICVDLDDTWAWIAPRPERQQVAMAGAPETTEDAPVVDEGAPAVPAPVQAP
ncbi:hypothetical protein Tco_0031008 [Tanacetum coccineum]